MRRSGRTTWPFEATIPQIRADSQSIDQVVRAIREAKRPVLYVGRGGVVAAGAAGQLREFVRKTDIPVVQTLMGLGVFPETHPLSLRMVGMHGTVYANYAINHADLLLAMGVRFDDRVYRKARGILQTRPNRAHRHRPF